METQQRTQQGSAAQIAEAKEPIVGSRAIVEFGVPYEGRGRKSHATPGAGHFQQLLFVNGEIPLRWVLDEETVATGDPRATTWEWRRRFTRIGSMINANTRASNHGSSLR